MTTWYFTIEASAPGLAGAHEIVEAERIVAFGRMLRKITGEASSSGGDGRYGAVIGVPGGDLEESLRDGLVAFRAARDHVVLPEWPIEHCEMVTTDEIERRRLRQTGPVVMGVAEVGRYLDLPFLGARETTQLLGVSRQRLNQLADRPDFPRPIARLAATPVWRTSDVEDYARNRRRTPGRVPAGWRLMNPPVPADPGQGSLRSKSKRRIEGAT